MPSPLTINKGYIMTTPNILILQIRDTHLVIQNHFLNKAYGIKIDF